jgi:hypothetical protein
MKNFGAVRKLGMVENNNERLDVVGNCDEKILRNGKLGSTIKHDEKIRHSGETRCGSKQHWETWREMENFGAVGKLGTTVGNSEGRRLTVRRKNLSKKLVCSELQKTLSNG